MVFRVDMVFVRMAYGEKRRGDERNVEEPVGAVAPAGYELVGGQPSIILSLANDGVC